MPESPIPRCPTCGRDALAVARAVHDVAADDGTLLRYEDEVYRCGNCGESVYTSDQSLASSRARAAALRVHEGLLSPAQITAIRETLGLSQADLEKALGIGPKTVVRWEKGTVRQSRAADRLLRILAAHPEHVRETATYLTTPNAPVADTQATVVGGTVMFSPVMPGTTLWPLALPPDFGMVTTTMIWSGAVVLNRPGETREEWEGVLETAPSELILAA